MTLPFTVKRTAPDVAAECPKMFRLFILCLVLRAAAAVTSEESEASGDMGDDEDEIVTRKDLNEVPPNNIEPGSVDKAMGNGEDGFTTIVVIAAVSVVALAAVAIAAIILVRRHMQNRQQGVYSVPTEQTQKAAV
ncbi:hypothetical protein AAFF_G00232860 [Aldrovandia affinis]|uniref:Uncharacterized protein n=1 Tax=Aldrovandia affinis TaxID=143900 RepID=A0AAD7W490_9TELE|nr:hypothetical protein AAFF_G00232860 [Aldrovandia affinis]